MLSWHNSLAEEEIKIKIQHINFYLNNAIPCLFSAYSISISEKSSSNILKKQYECGTT